MRTPWLFTLVLLAASAVRAGAQSNDVAQNQTPVFTDTVDVIAATPLPGLGVPIDQVPAPVQTSTAQDLENSGALDLTSFLNRRLLAVHINEVQGNAFQPDVSYRGYTASPLLGTPQGLSIYMDGVRLNQPFGDVVSWDLIPRMAISSSVLMPGSNPLFGLNTLGGALSLHTKDGRTAPGTHVRALYGSSLRRALELEHGGQSAPRGLDWYVAGNLFGEDGWREESPSDVRQLFGKVGWLRGTNDLRLSIAHADNTLHGNGLQELRLLNQDYASVYTKPDINDNRSTMLNLTARRQRGSNVTLSATTYYRHIRTSTLNGDINEDSLDQSVYQPSAAERAALAAAGYTGVPASGATAENTPFPFWRCLGNVLLQDEPAEKCNGLINRSHSAQHNAGVTAEATVRRSTGRQSHQVTTGAAYDWSRVRFDQSTELGYLDADRSVVGTGVFADGENGGNLDGEPFDNRVDLRGRLHTWSLYATDTWSLNRAWHVTLSGRFNQTTVTNRDQITPGGGPASLDGEHTFRRFNPAAGVTFAPTSSLTMYGGYSEGSRAATSIELGCANPDQPCRLPNALAGDPPLDQVVTRTVEGGVRARASAALTWNLGVFRAENRDDILFVTSTQSGFGYFKNFGQTRRAGVEGSVSWRPAARMTVGAGYTWLRATYQSEETVNGSGNSSNSEAEDEQPGSEGTIAIEPGARIPLVPEHTLKMYADAGVTHALSISADMIAASGVLARGNENGAHETRLPYYVGPGETDPYAVVNVSARYQVRRWFEIVGQVTNLFDRHYSTAAQLGPTGITEAGTYIARPFPAINGEFPVQQSTFFAPGAPRLFSVGMRVSF